jgi:hypothetical protein
MDRVVLRHRRGSIANQRKEFLLATVHTFGREPSCEVGFDPDRDDLVGRQHARITRDSGNPAPLPPRWAWPVCSWSLWASWASTAGRQRETLHPALPPPRVD